MPNSPISKMRQFQEEAQALLDVKQPDPHDDKSQNYLLRFAHFWVLTGRSFVRNRCPVRAAALAYTTLLALVPLLAVVISVSTSLLKKDEGERQIRVWVNTAIDKLAPQLGLFTKDAPVASTGTEQAEPMPAAPPAESPPGKSGAAPSKRPEHAGQPTVGPSGTTAAAEGNAREKIVNQIMQFVRNFQSGALGVSGMLGLVFVAISLLANIEATLNDMWGVAQGRKWFARVVQYWASLTLGPMLLFLAIGLTTGKQFHATQAFIDKVPVVGTILFRILPVVILCLACALFYAVMPNTRVNWGAALAGGAVAGCLLQLNSTFNVIYVSRVVTYKQVYGSLAILPLFLVGLYFSWMILLFGAQTAYAVQNRKAYAQERQLEKVSQRDREFVAFRLMTMAGARFHAGQCAPTTLELADGLGVPTRLATQIIGTLLESRLLAEVLGKETGYLPARPLNQITSEHILTAMRVGQHRSIETLPDEGRAIVRGDFEAIHAAQRATSEKQTLQSLVERVAAQPQPAPAKA